jgi:hypothetical protein
MPVVTVKSMLWTPWPQLAATASCAHSLGAAGAHTRRGRLGGGQLSSAKGVPNQVMHKDEV